MKRCFDVLDYDGKLMGHAVECPACRDADRSSIHVFMLKTGTGPGWTFNSSYERPTFSPSMLSREYGGHVCHSFVRDGCIEYLSDCTHPLAGQIVDLPEQT